MGDDILQMIVCLRDGKPEEAVEYLKARCPGDPEANNVALDCSLDIKTKLGELVPTASATST